MSEGKYFWICEFLYEMYRKMTQPELQKSMGLACTNSEQHLYALGSKAMISVAVLGF